MLKGKTAVVTGGSRGIGEAIVYKLASMGANVAVIYAAVGQPQRGLRKMQAGIQRGSKSLSMQCC